MPLYLISALGGLFIIFALLLSLQTFSLWFGGVAVEGFTTVIILQLLIGGLILSALGIIGIYLAKIFEEAKRRPRFIISETIGIVE